MIEHLANLIETFPGAANQTRCFMHIINLVAKSVLRQFETSKVKGKNAMDDAKKELAAVFEALDSHSECEASESGGNGNDEDDDVVVDNEDGLPDERDGMSDKELTSLEENVKPIRLVLTKVSQFKLLFKQINNYCSLNSSEAFPWPLKTPPPSSFLNGMKFSKPLLSSNT
jgi:hypothetical protein